MRPLFEALSAHHERPDEWSGSLGFVIGGCATPAMQAERDGVLAEHYFAAAEALVDAILDRRVADHTVANAALFLYRHCIELLLKSGLPPAARAEKNIHHLGRLARSYAHYKSQEGHVVPAWLISRCDELALIDPSSVAFRYGEHGSLNEDWAADELHVDLVHLKSAMKAVHQAIVEQNFLIRTARGQGT